MPWSDVSSMDQKLLFIADYKRQVFTFAELCRRFGVSRKTGYKWARRFDEGGVSALNDRSCSPHSCPHKTPQQLVDAIIEHDFASDSERLREEVAEVASRQRAKREATLAVLESESASVEVKPVPKGKTNSEPELCAEHPLSMRIEALLMAGSRPLTEARLAGGTDSTQAD